jgi:cytochrome b561
VVVLYLFDIPAAFTGFESQEDIAGEMHEWLTDILTVLI